MTARVAGALAGRRVAVTRAAGQAPELLELLRARGAEALACPTISVEPPASYAPLDAALHALDRYDWAVFTSANGVRAVADRLEVLAVRVPPGLHLAAVGTATGRVLASRVREADFVPRAALAEGLGRELPDVSGRRILFPRGDLAADVLVRTLHTRGAAVDEVIAYRTTAGAGAGELARLVRAGRIDAILFMSASSVGHFTDALYAEPAASARGLAVVCIGPETARAAREAGLDVSATATERTAAGIVDALERWYGRHGDVQGR